MGDALRCAILNQPTLHLQIIGLATRTKVDPAS
jgi:hypothetical protein